ncbi:alpha/beta-hydrolase [Xylariaceae sp. FL1651]|nr:alpha/beta-hydrolase [Xylariaceae sp. FL1651]
MALNGTPAHTVKVQQHTDLWTTIKFYICGFLFNRYVSWGTRYLYSKYPDFWQPRAPTTIKHYAVRPNLEARIFIPKSNNANAKFPVFLLIHGGGWTMGDARMDDEQAHLLADKYGFCVASIEYGLGPGNRFPVPIHDCLAHIKAVIADESLPLNLDKVILGGFSAGGVMALALAQLPDLKHVIKALVTFYPLTDWTGQDRPSPGVLPWGKPEELPKSLPLFQWTYVPAGQDLCDPLLSPSFAKRDNLSQPLFMITAEGDFLYREAQLMACRLAGAEGDSEICNSESWEKNGVRYRRVRDMPHGFTHFFAKIPDPEWEAKRLKTNDDIWQEINEWAKRILKL